MMCSRVWRASPAVRFFNHNTLCNLSFSSLSGCNCMFTAIYDACLDARSCPSPGTPWQAATLQAGVCASLHGVHASAGGLRVIDCGTVATDLDPSPRVQEFLQGFESLNHWVIHKSPSSLDAYGAQEECGSARACVAVHPCMLSTRTLYGCVVRSLQ